MLGFPLLSTVISHPPFFIVTIESVLLSTMYMYRKYEGEYQRFI